MIPKEVFEETLLQFLDPIRPFLDDAGVSEIMINGPNQIFIERNCGCGCGNCWAAGGAGV